MRVLIIDDHPLYRAGLKSLLAALDGHAQLHEAANAEEAVTLAGSEGFDLVLLDMNLPGTHRVAALQQVKEAFPAACVAVVSAEEDPALVLACIEGGAAGYIPKSSDPALMVQALSIVLAQGTYLPGHVLRSLGTLQAMAPQRPSLPTLSDRQRDVLHRLLQGKPNKVIAREMDIAEGTVKAHLWAVYQILGVSTRAQAMCRAHELGLLPRRP